MRHVKIRSVGWFAPPDAISNEQLVQRHGLDVDAAWIEKRTGIRSRRWLAPGLATSDMAFEAARIALERAGVAAGELDRIVLATLTPDHPSPAAATRLAHKLGARCAAFDVSAACSGFLYALDLAVGSIRGGEERVLIVGADARSRFVDPDDRRSLVLFADGAGAALVTPSDEPGLRSIVLGAECGEALGAHVPAGGSLRPTTAESVAAGDHFVKVDALPAVFETFLRLNREACEGALRRAGASLDDIDVYVCHQGNRRLLELVVADLGFHMDQAIDTVVEFGNTASATIPMALAQALESGRIEPGQDVLISGVGAGYTFGAAVHRF